jgi:hypothetical protein
MSGETQFLVWNLASDNHLQLDSAAGGNVKHKLIYFKENQCV